MTYLDNPAGRLLALFEAARRQPQEEAAVKGWSNVFEIKQKNTTKFMKRATHMHELASETRTKVELLEDSHPEIVLEHFTEVETTLQKFQVVLNQNMKTFLSDLGTKSGEHSLKLCSAILHKRSPEINIPEDTAAHLTKSINSLIEEVIDTDDLDPLTKQWVVGRLNEVLDVLLDLRINGAPDLEVAHERLIGGLVSKPSRIAAIHDSKIKNKLLGLLVTIDLLVNFGANLRQLTATQTPNPSPIIVIVGEQLEATPEAPALPPASNPPDEPN